MAKQAQLFREFTQAERDEAEKKGHAMPGGGFPINSAEDLKNAIHAIGRAKDPAAAKAHIKKRAAALGKSDLVPEEWGVGGRLRLIFGAASAYEVEVPAEPETVIVAGKEYVRGKTVHIFPLGEWSAVDGRRIAFDRRDAAVLIADANARRNDIAITTDHEKHDSDAAGWMQNFELREDGLWATDVKWTRGYFAPDGKTFVEGAYEQIKAGKYRYLSGDSYGLGDGSENAPFHPRRILAASRVPKPAIDGLKEIQLSQRDEEAAKNEKEKSMDKERIEKFRKQLQLAADTSDEQVMEHLEKAVEAQKKDKDEDAKNEAHRAKLAARDGEHKPECDNEECAGCKEKGSEQMSAKEKDAATAKDAAVQAIAKEIAEGAIEGVTVAAKAHAEKLTKAEFAAREKEKAVDTDLLTAEKEGRLTPAERDGFRKQLMSADADSAKFAAEQLKSRPVKAPTDRLPEALFAVTDAVGGGPGAAGLKAMLFQADGQPKYKQTTTFLTQVARFAAHKCIPIDAAKIAVMKGENRELEEELVKAQGRTAEDFGEGAGIGQFRTSNRMIPVDPEMVEFIRKRVRSGHIPEQIVPAQIQQFASIADFQPSARTTLPVALGYYQAEFVGDEALPVFVGGADEKAAWAEFLFEKFAAVAKATGLLGSPTRTSLNVTWHTVTLDKYPVRVDIDRRARAASVTLPRGIDTIAMENAKSQVGVTKEVAQMTLLATNGNYYDSSYYPTISTPWSTAGNPASYAGVPITDVSVGMAHVRSGVRTWPDLLLLSPNSAISMRKNQQVIDTVRYTGTMERPGTMVSDATLAAIFQGIFNVTIVVGGAGYSLLPSGAAPADVWGNDAWLICTGQGRIEAPRFGMTVTAAGSPRVRAFPNEDMGADGSDSIVYTDAWSVVSVSKKAAYWMKNASASL